MMRRVILWSIVSGLASGGAVHLLSSPKTVFAQAQAPQPAETGRRSASGGAVVTESFAMVSNATDSTTCQVAIVTNDGDVFCTDGGKLKFAGNLQEERDRARKK